MSAVAFTKMHSSGNDYVYVDATQFALPNPAELARRWSARHTGVGSDGLVLIGSSTVADFRMRIFNADGSEGQICGNASLCVGKYVFDKQLTAKTTVTLETLSGTRVVRLHVVDGAVGSATVDMGVPRILDAAATIECGASASFTGAEVSVGNPHFVVFVSDAEAVQLEHDGPLIEQHPHFPDRTNVEFMSVCADNAIRMRVWERGSGITQGCGSGACAAAVAAIAQGRVHSPVTVQMDGGQLQVSWAEGGAVSITGVPVCVFDGVIAA